MSTSDASTAVSAADSPAVAATISVSRHHDEVSVPPSRLYRLTVEQYREMGAAGIFDGGPKVKLLAGVLIEKMNHGPNHSDAIGALSDELRRIAPRGWHVREQLPLALPDSVPEPDLMLVRGERQAMRGRHPAPSDVGLVIEVADSSLRQDRDIKKTLYARAGGAEYWIVNVTDSCIEVYTKASGPITTPDFQSRRDYAREEVVPVVLDGQTLGSIVVRKVLPGDAT